LRRHHGIWIFNLEINWRRLYLLKNRFEKTPKDIDINLEINWRRPYLLKIDLTGHLGIWIFNLEIS